MNSTWHTREISDILEELNTSEKGLEKEEAQRRLEEHGANKLPEAKVDGTFVIFLRQFQSALIYILVVAAAIVFLIGEPVDGIIILFVLLFNAVIGTIQEGKAQNTLLALKHFVETKALVMRSGEELIVPDSEIVFGDIIILQEGDKIPADARIIVANNLKVDEAALTGESSAVHKTPSIISNKDATTIEQKNMVFKGTHIVSGHGRAVVVGTGLGTVIGQIAKEISTIDTEIPLKTNIRNLSRLIIAATLIICALLFVLGKSAGNSTTDMFATVVSVAVSVIPSGLPIAVTLILATGVWRMSKRNALVKRLQAVEALGRARVIAVDKTGTITKNEMVIQSVLIGGKHYEISGVGYEPKGSVTLEGNPIDPPEHAGIIFAGKIATLCANARTAYSAETEDWKVTGDPTEAAMFVLGQKLGFNKDNLEREHPQVSEIPFDYRLKYHATAHTSPDGELVTVVGAPEVVLRLCNKIWDESGERELNASEIDQLEAQYSELSKRGLRILAFATTSNIPENLTSDSLTDLTLGGFYGMKDALRGEVQDATRRAKAAGLRVVMITGDHKGTAEALAREALIFKDGDRVLTGEDVDSMSDLALKDALTNTTVFARVTPEHKFRIVTAYKSRGDIIAMTGDGVNDAPSLVAADLGVAMGKIGTEVAKEASDIILLDDNFDSIISAIEEGRSIHKTIKKVVVYLMSTSIGEVLVIAGALLLGFPLPLLPAQIIWLNFVTDGLFIPALAMEPREQGLLNHSPEKSNKYLIDSSMAQRMIFMGLPMMIGTLVLFSQYYESNLAKAWTISLTLLAVFQWFNAWNCRSEIRSVFRMNFWSNRYLIFGTLGALACQLLAVYHPLFQSFLRTVPLNLSDWLVIIAFASSIIVVDELRKLVISKTSRTPAELAFQASN